MSWARIGSRCAQIVESSRCKLDALFKLHLVLSKHTFQYAYLVTTCLLLQSCLRVLVSWGLAVMFEEGDGRCVRVSWPYSTRHSIPSLLLNPPLVFRFHKNFRVDIGMFLV